ncbi:MAG: hypothetical protein ACLFQ2_00450 [Wenzhouxiangella sp.]
MSKTPKSADMDKLQALYRQQAEAEPDSGLDRLIRARAEQALATSRRRGPAPWIAGLATAGALVLAIGIVVLQAPPPAPEIVHPERSAAPLGEDSARALRSAPMSAQPQADAARAAPAGAESALMAELAETAPEAAADDLQEIRELLAAGQTEAARVRLEQLLENEPDLELPDEWRRLLDNPNE